MGEERVIPAPPLDRHREGEILTEQTNSLGLELWQHFRHLRDWAAAGPAERMRLFRAPTSEVLARRREARLLAPDIGSALDLFAELTTKPQSGSRERIASACEEVVEWALSSDCTKTAIEWAELAARIHPDNPRTANLAGRVTRNACDFERSETWFQIGIGKAREQENRVELTRAHLGYGTLCKELGRVQSARRHLSAGANLAWRHGPPSLAAEAQHDLCAMLMLRGHLTEAADRARRALEWYPESHHRLPFFAADVALMLVLARRFTAAARLLRGVLRVVRQPVSARATILALTARAYAGAGEPEESAVMRRRSLRLLAKDSAMEPVLRWHLADALRLAGKFDDALREAEATLAVSLQRNDREIERLARRLLYLIGQRRSERAAAAPVDIREFLRQLSDKLSRWSPRRGREWPGPWGERWAA